jgi:hypothetical protein
MQGEYLNDLILDGDLINTEQIDLNLIFAN